MNDPEANALAALKKQVADLSLAVKVALFVILLGVSYFNIRVAFYIPRFDLVYRDMLSGKPLPADTWLVFAARKWLVALACALPAIGITALLAKSTRASVITFSICLLVTVAQYVFTWWALASPLVMIAKAISGTDG